MKLVLLAIILMLGSASSSEDSELVGELKDLLMDSVRNTIALNELVTHQTQQISEIMLSLSATQTKLQKMEQENSDLLKKVDQLRLEIQGELAALRNETNNKLVELQENMEEEQGVTKARLDTLQENMEGELVVTNARLVVLEQTMEEELEAVGRRELTGPEITILNGEESNGNSNCAKVCSGTTGRTTTNWISYTDNGAKVEVDISECGFVKIPTVITSIEGDGWHWYLTGTSAVYDATTSSFRTQIRRDSGYTDSSALGNARNARTNEWNVEWIAVGFTC